MTQYALPLALPAVYAEDNFTVGAPHRDAWQWVSSWPKWPAHALVLWGEPGSGKSHLGHIWQQKSDAQIIEAAELAGADISAMGRQNWLVENLHQLKDEEALLHLYNLTREHKQWLLLTSTLPAQQLPLTLPDLTSRLLSLPSAGIQTADDETVAALLRKQLADRQLKVEDDIIAYLLPRIDRSYIKINNLISGLDHAALARGKKLTIPFIREQLALPPVA